MLSLVPSVEDDGKYLTCRAENKHIPDSAIEDKWRLNVHCEYDVIVLFARTTDNFCIACLVSHNEMLIMLALVLATTVNIRNGLGNKGN